MLMQDGMQNVNARPRPSSIETKQVLSLSPHCTHDRDQTQDLVDTAASHLRRL